MRKELGKPQVMDRNVVKLLQRIRMKFTDDQWRPVCRICGNARRVEYVQGVTQLARDLMEIKESEEAESYCPTVHLC